MRPAAVAAVLLLAVGWALPAAAGSFRAGGTLYDVETRSLADMHFQNVVRQRFDLSCGAAAMATLLRHFYDESNVDEQQVIDAMVELGDPEKIARDGFSMLELKRYAESRGFVSEGFRIENVGKLAKLKVPVITLINTRGYNHFVVLKTMREDGKLVIADPAFGNVVKGQERFESEWNQVILVVLSRELDGERAFARDFSIKAPLSDVTLLINRGPRAIPGGAGEF